MPRFDPPHYLMEHDGTRLREAQHALVNARGHYLGATASAGAKLTKEQIGPALKGLSAAQKKQAIKNNKSAILAAFRDRGVSNITVNDDGTLHLRDAASALDASLRGLLNTPMPSFVFDQSTKKIKSGTSKKLSDLIDDTPLSARQKIALKQSPFTTMLDVFNPILGLLNDPQDGALVDVMRTQGRVFDLSTFPFNIRGATRVDISLVQDGDELFDQASQNNLLRQRTMTAFIVLYFRKWAELHAALVRKGLELVFGKDDTKLVSVGAGGDGSSFDKPRIVTSMPVVWRGGSRKEIPAGPYLIRRYTSGGLPTRRDLDDVTKLVWEIPQDNRKNQTRSFVQLTQAAWDQWRRPRAGLINARLDEGRPINGLGSLGATGAEEGIALVTAEGATLSIGPAVAVALVVGAFTVQAASIGVAGAIILAAMGYKFVFLVDVKEGKVGVSTDDGKTPLPPVEPPALFDADGTASTQSTGDSGGGVSPLLIGGAVLAALFILRKGSKA